jgi:hypothetical protein
MKRFSSLLILSTLLAVTAFAAEGGSGKITLDSSESWFDSASGRRLQSDLDRLG